MEPAALAEIANGIFGPERVSVAERLDDAIELGVALADEADAADGPGSAGVLITGSVITAGDARVLLAGAGTDAAESGSSEAAARIGADTWAREERS
jgi:hypothetical protein